MWPNGRNQTELTADDTNVADVSHLIRAIGEIRGESDVKSWGEGEQWTRLLRNSLLLLSLLLLGLVEKDADRLIVVDAFDGFGEEGGDGEDFDLGDVFLG